MIFINRNFIISVFTFIISVNIYSQIIQNEVEYRLSSGVYEGTNLIEPTNLYTTVQGCHGRTVTRKESKTSRSVRDVQEQFSYVVFKTFTSK